MIGLLTIGLIGLALCKKRSVSGIGAVQRVKRRIYKEIAAAQKLGVDFDLKYPELTNSQINSLEEVGNMFGWKQTKRSIESGKRYTEAYYNSLKRAYNAISGVGIGAVDYNTYTIRNGKGKIILQWREYDPVVEHLQQEPVVEIVEQAVEPKKLTKQEEILQVWPYLKTAVELDRWGDVIKAEVRDNFNYVVWRKIINSDGEVLAEGPMMSFFTEVQAKEYADRLRKKFRDQQEDNRRRREAKQSGLDYDKNQILIKHVSKIKPQLYL